MAASRGKLLQSSIVGIIIASTIAGLAFYASLTIGNHTTTPLTSSSITSTNSTTNFSSSPITTFSVQPSQTTSTLTTVSSTSTSTTSTSTRFTTTLPSGPSPPFEYIFTNNSADAFGTSIYVAIANSGQLAFVAESGYQDSVILISNNEVIQIIQGDYETPTGIAFDSSNGVAYVTYGIPGDCNSCPYGMVGISNGKGTTSPIQPQGWPAAIAFDKYNGYLYVSYAQAGRNTAQGIGILNPSTESQVGMIPLNGAPNSYAYNTATGGMFAAISHNDEYNTTIYNVNGISIANNFTVSGAVAKSGMVYDSADGYLYLDVASSSNGKIAYNIIVVSPSTDSIIATMNTAAPSPMPMIYDSNNGYVYVFEPGQMLGISGTNLASSTPTLHNVTAAVYNEAYDSILACY